MIILAIVATIASILWSLFVLFANSMSDAPQADPIGIGTIGFAWIVTIVLWIACFF